MSSALNFCSLLMKRHKKPNVNLRKVFCTSSNCDEDSEVSDTSCVRCENMDEKKAATKIEQTSVENISRINAVPPTLLETRTARIHKTTKNAMQSGTNDTHCWKIDFGQDTQWEHHLMGWTSGADPLLYTKLRFRHLEEAINYCVRNAWRYVIECPQECEQRKKSYSANFSWNRRTRVSTKWNRRKIHSKLEL